MSDPEVSRFMGNLRMLLHKEFIPTSGPLFRATYPLFALFVFCATIEREDDFAKDIIQELRLMRNFTVSSDYL